MSCLLVWWLWLWLWQQVCWMELSWLQLWSARTITFLYFEARSEQQFLMLIKFNKTAIELMGTLSDHLDPQRRRKFLGKLNHTCLLLVFHFMEKS
jgi:hypothetical protein